MIYTKFSTVTDRFRWKKKKRHGSGREWESFFQEWNGTGFPPSFFVGLGREEIHFCGSGTGKVWEFTPLSPSSVCASKRERGSVCVCVRERERECVCVRQREREGVCVCVRERESVCVCVCVCVTEREGVCVTEREGVCVCAWQRERECVCVRDRERESVCVCVCVCVLEHMWSTHPTACISQAWSVLWTEAVWVVHGSVYVLHVELTEQVPLLKDVVLQAEELHGFVLLSLQSTLLLLHQLHSIQLHTNTHTASNTVYLHGQNQSVHQRWAAGIWWLCSVGWCLLYLLSTLLVQDLHPPAQDIDGLFETTGADDVLQVLQHAFVVLRLSFGLHHGNLLHLALTKTRHMLSLPHLHSRVVTVRKFSHRLIDLTSHRL